MGLIADPGFDDPSAWDIRQLTIFNPAGCKVEGSQLIVGVDLIPPALILGNAIIEPVGAVVATVGKEYAYTINVSSYVTASSAQVTYGGQEIWSKADGAGLFTGSITASTAYGLIFGVTNAGFVVDSVQITPMHARQSIRSAVAGIVTGLTTTGSRVFQSRSYNVQESELPCLLVYTVNEEVTGAQSIASPRRIERQLEVIIEAKHQATETLDNTLDDITEEVEIAMGSDPSLGVNAVDCMLSSISTEFSAEADPPIGSAIMRYLVTYITAENAPGSLL